MSELLISPILKSYHWMRKFNYKKPLENSLVKYGVKVKNIDEKPFEGGTIKNIVVYPSGLSKDANLVWTCDKEFKIKELNPGEEVFIWFEKIAIAFSGRIWLSFNLEGKGSVTTYQWNEGSQSQSKSGENKWRDIFSVKDENILQQQITNVLLVILTVLILIF